MDGNSNLRHGSLVCLRDTLGQLLIAQQSTMDWELVAASSHHNATSLPAEALYLVVRRGSQIGFQCIGAEGRMVQARDHSDPSLGLDHGFSSRESWEICPTGCRLLNCHFRSRELGLRVQQVTALPTADLTQLEETWEGQIVDMRNQLDTHKQSSSGSEHSRAAGLIKAGRRAGLEGPHEADLRSKLETANRLAMRWQEEAARSALALQAAQQTVVSLQQADNAAGVARNGQPPAELATGGHNDRASPSNVEYAVRRVRLEADAMLQARDAEHAAILQRLLEEKARLDAALCCIKELVASQQARSAAATAPGTGQATTMQAVEEPLPMDLFTEAVQEPLAVSLGRDSAASGGSPQRVACPASDTGADSPLATTCSDSDTITGSLAAGANTPGSPSLAHYSPVPADHAVFNAVTRGRISGLYDLINPFRPASVLSDGAMHWCTSDTAYQAAGAGFINMQQREGTDDEEEFASPLNTGSCTSGGHSHSADSMHRVTVGEHGACLVDYTGCHPDAVNEQAMNRILDAPPPPQQKSSRAMKRIHQRSSHTSPERAPCQEAGAAAAFAGGPSSVSAPASAAKSEHSLPADDVAGWPVGSLSLPVSHATSPRGGAHVNAAHALLELPVTAAVQALDTGSPTDASFVVNFMADGVTARASLPIFHPSRRRHSGAKAAAVAGPDAPAAAALRHSAPAAPAERKRSSFLQRPLLRDNDVYGTLTR